MNVAVHDTADEVRISLAGDLDTTVEDEVIATLLRAADKPNIKAMRVDATQISFIDSSGLRALLIGLQAALDRGIEFVLEVTPDGRVAKLLTLAKLDQHFNVS